MLKQYSLLIAMAIVLVPFAVRVLDTPKPRPNSDKEPIAEKFLLYECTVSRHGVGELDKKPEVRDLPHQLRSHDGGADG